MIVEFPREGEIHLGETGIVKMSSLSQVGRRVEICGGRPRSMSRCTRKTTNRENGIIHA